MKQLLQSKILRAKWSRWLSSYPQALSIFYQVSISSSYQKGQQPEDERKSEQKIKGPILSLQEDTLEKFAFRRTHTATRERGKKEKKRKEKKKKREKRKASKKDHTDEEPDN